MAFSYQPIDDFARRTAPLSPYYVLNGGAAVIWHFRHRSTNDLDFYLEPGTWDKVKGPMAIFSALKDIAPAQSILDSAVEIGKPVRVRKINFTNITLSFIQTPMTKKTKDFVSPPNRINIASPKELLLVKLVAVGTRDHFFDFLDLSYILTVTNENDILYALDEIADRNIELTTSLPECFRILSNYTHPDLTDEQIGRLRQFGNSGLLVLKCAA